MNDIVRQLREAADSFYPQDVEDDSGRFKDLYLEAANAIEQLQETRRKESKRCGCSICSVCKGYVWQLAEGAELCKCTPNEYEKENAK